MDVGMKVMHPFKNLNREMVQAQEGTGTVAEAAGKSYPPPPRP